MYILEKGKSKILIILFILFFSALASATNFGSERNIAVSIDENEFGYTKTVETDEYFYLKVRIIDENSIALRNYHIDFKVEDKRGALVADYSQIEIDGILFRILSDDNGFINFAFPINTCGAIQQDFCYQQEETYTFRIIQNGLDRRETFRVEPQILEHNWIGQLIRWVILNMEWFFIVVFLLILLLSLIASGYWLFKGKR